MHRPWPTLRRMLEDLSKAGVPISRNTTRIHRRAEEWLPAGSKSEKEEGLITSMLNAAIAKQPAIPGEVAGRNSGAITQYGQLDWPVLPRTKGREAYATIVTYPSTEYVYAAAVLSHSLQMFDSSREFVALVTEKIPNETREKLKKSGYKVRPVPLIPDTWYGGNYSQCQSEKKKESADYEDRKTRWGLMMSKLHLWNMLEYDKVVYFDVDAIVTGPVNVLFGMLPSARTAVDSRQVILVGRKGHSQTGFNAGVMALVPSRKLFSAMVERTQQPPPERRAGDVQFAPALCTEQALLNDMIPPARVRLLGADMLAHPHVRDWQEMQWKRRPYEKGSGWPLLFHWVGCRKPWQVGKTDIESDLAADGTLKKYHTCDGVPNVLWWRWARRVIPPDQLRWLHPPASRSKRGECGQVGGITASDGSACCPKACGVCGGEGCGDKPGGAKACCLDATVSRAMTRVSNALLPALRKAIQSAVKLEMKRRMRDEKWRRQRKAAGAAKRKRASAAVAAAEARQEARAEAAEGKATAKALSSFFAKDR